MSLLHTIQTEDEDAQMESANQMIYIANPCMIRRWSKSKLLDGKLLIQMPKDNAHLIDLEFTEDDNA